MAMDSEEQRVALPPVVLVPGFGALGLTLGKFYWDSVHSDNINLFGLTVHETSPGPFSSQHDRACELFSQIRGCRVDFGEDHSTSNRHERYGRDFTGHGLYPEWGPDKPVHLLCHSLGGNTARMLQYLLQKDFWGVGSSAKCILSITCITCALNGITALCLFGVNETTGSDNFETTLEIVDKLTYFLHWIYTKHRLTVAQRQLMETWHLNHWGIHGNITDNSNWREQMKESNILSTKDHLLFDATFHGCQSLNEEVGYECPTTYYISLYARTTDRTKPKPIPPTICPMFEVSSAYILNTRFSSPPLSEITKDDDFLENDGVASVGSQRYPVGRESTARQIIANSNLEPGVWNYCEITSLLDCAIPWDHMDAVWARTFQKTEDMQHSEAEQIRLYEFIFKHLSTLSYD